MQTDDNTGNKKSKLLAKLHALPPTVQAVILGKAIAKRKTKDAMVHNAIGHDRATDEAPNLVDSGRMYSDGSVGACGPTNATAVLRANAVVGSAADSPVQYATTREQIWLNGSIPLDPAASMDVPPATGPDSAHEHNEGRLESRVTDKTPLIATRLHTKRASPKLPVRTDEEREALNAQMKARVEAILAKRRLH